MFKGRSFLVKMVKDDESGHEEEVDVTEDIRSHFQKNKNAYITGSIFAFAGIAYLATRGAGGPHIDREISQVAKNGIAVNAKSVAMHNVSVIAANRQGPPSWVVRCIETGAIFSSQRSAAAEMGIKEAMLSRHLNGLLEHADGNHFERICMAA